MQSPQKSTNPIGPRKTSIDIKRPQMTSKEPVIADSTNQAHFIGANFIMKSKLQSGSMHEINDE